jgi:Domain of unknown function (DUF6817)
MSAVDLALEELRILGANSVEHINTDLEEHLRSTSRRLRAWCSPNSLCMAGLFHAVYGTYGFHHQLIGIERRSEVAAIIGREAEAIVYFYCACDRMYFYPRLAKQDTPEVRDRFTGEVHIPSAGTVKFFCELTIANEIDVCAPDPAGYRSKYGHYVMPLFTSTRFKRNLTNPAVMECERYFPEGAR